MSEDPPAYRPHADTGAEHRPGAPGPQPLQPYHPTPAPYAALQTALAGCRAAQANAQTLQAARDALRAGMDVLKDFLAFLTEQGLAICTDSCGRSADDPYVYEWTKSELSADDLTALLAEYAQRIGQTPLQPDPPP